MTDRPAAIAGSLVSMKNVGAHKSVVLTLHVPEEHALKVIEAFGWPTMANPVSVAVARLSETAEQRSNHSAQGGADSFRVSEGSRPASASPASEKRQRTLAEKAAWYCKSPSFQDWLLGTHSCYDDALKQCDGSYGPGNWSYEHAAKHTIYIHCGVTSRGDIIAGSVAGRLFLDLEAQFHDWQRRAA